MGRRIEVLDEAILGRTGLKVKKLGFGGIPIQRISEKETIEVIRRCYELGINYFDTARSYTVSEERVGKALEDIRDDVFIATKSNKRTKDGVLEELEISLKKLRTDYIDVYQLHNVSSNDDWEKVTSPNGALEALYEARDKGKIEHLGVTSHNPAVLTKIVKENLFETIQIPFNYLSTMAEEELLPSSQKMNIGTIIMKPFGGGTFSNPNVALKFILKNKNVDVVIPGVSNISEVEENVAISAPPYDLNTEELAIIEKDKKELGNQFCRACEYCQPCPQEIAISMVLRAETFLKRLKGTASIKDLFRDVVDEVSTCTECGECESRCPYHLPIIKMLPVKVKLIEKEVQD